MYNRFFFQWNWSFKTSIAALLFGGHENHNSIIWWLGISAKTTEQRRRTRLSCDGRDWQKNRYREIDARVVPFFFSFDNFFYIKFWVYADRSMCNCLVVTNIAIRTLYGFSYGFPCYMLGFYNRNVPNYDVTKSKKDRNLQLNNYISLRYTVYIHRVYRYISYAFEYLTSRINVSHPADGNLSISL